MIKVCEPVIKREDILSVVKYLENGQVSGTSPVVHKFEEKWAEFCGRSYGVAVSNGTVALELAIRSLNIPKGKWVILPDLTIVSCALAIVRNGLVPVPVDVYPDTWNMNMNQVEYLIRRHSDKIGAIMPVHMYGQACDMEKLDLMLQDTGIYIIEDAAEAHGAYHSVGFVGGPVADLSCFSFYANKLISCGEGGMILLDDLSLYRDLCGLRDLGRRSGYPRFYHPDLGYNFRMSAMQAALGMPQIGRMESIVAKKVSIAKLYRKELEGLPIKFQEGKEVQGSVFWMNAITSPFIGTIVSCLTMHDVETRDLFMPIHLQPCLKDYFGLVPQDAYPVSGYIYNHGCYLPSGLGLSDSNILYICYLIKEALQDVI